MAWGGPAQQRGHIAHSLAAHAGATPLGALVVGETASFYFPCWEKDREIAARLIQANGRHPHPRSVARARRFVIKLGILESKRIYSGQRPHGASYHTAGGTTSKQVRWDRLGSKDPLNRGERRRGRLRQVALERARNREERRMIEAQAEQAALQPTVGPRYSSPVPQPDAALAQFLAEATEQQQAAREANWTRQATIEDARMMDSVLRPPPPEKPPD